MKHLFPLPTWAPCLGLLATLLATPTAGFSSGQLPPGTTTAARRSPAAASAKKGYSRLVATGLQPARVPAAPLTNSQPARPAAVVPAAPIQPQLVTLRGVVVRPTGQPCPGASVYEARAPRQVVVTDAQGAFALSVVAGTATLLRVEYFGEGSSRIEIPVPTVDLLHITLGQ